MQELKALILSDTPGGEVPIVAPTILGKPYPLTAGFALGGDFTMIDFQAGSDEDAAIRHIAIPQPCIEVVGALRNAKAMRRLPYFMVGPVVPGAAHSMTGEPVLFGTLCFIRALLS
ncbi:hypothetical protein [Mesorhizobium sp.]|uniref:hypothetical protein n=1 Tax=Mesorhizobium sp. TaxID=1871066 RepID=UPI000FEAA44D|nr:hypothetical protein [Mesorhizobium sp.]RWD70880.1 MAG: hypothetical protein EOS37_13260 [Mesorhizobium sp.]